MHEFLQVLVDADNVSASRARAVLRALPLGEAQIVVAGSRRALAAVAWPKQAVVTATEGWQEADMVLARAYQRGAHPLVLVSGDGDFGHLAFGHPGPVLVVSDRPAVRLREAGTVIDPVKDGVDALRRWFDAVLDEPQETGVHAGSAAAEYPPHENPWGELSARAAPAGTGSGRMGGSAIEAMTHLRPVPCSARTARRFVHAILRGWSCSHAADIVALLTSEVITNAVLHARTRIILRVHRFNGTVRVEVGDGSERPPVVQHYDDDAQTGRGLQLLETLAERWGVSPDGPGKVVWFEVAA